MVISDLILIFIHSDTIQFAEAKCVD
jgi:hypothetical protein